MSRIYDSTRTITMAESSDTRYTVAKLNNSNYQIWKFKVKMLLIREDTWTVVQGVIPDPVPDDWQRKDETAQCTISLTVEDNQLVHICNCTSARDMWKQLQKVHERSNRHNRNKETRTCFFCKRQGHLRRIVLYGRQERSRNQGRNTGRKML